MCYDIANDRKSRTQAQKTSEALHGVKAVPEPCCACVFYLPECKKMKHGFHDVLCFSEKTCGVNILYCPLISPEPSSPRSAGPSHSE